MYSLFCILLTCKRPEDRVYIYMSPKCLAQCLANRNKLDKYMLYVYLCVLSTIQVHLFSLSSLCVKSASRIISETCLPAFSFFLCPCLPLQNQRPKDALSLYSSIACNYSAPKLTLPQAPLQLEMTRQRLDEWQEEGVIPSCSSDNKENTVRKCSPIIQRRTTRSNLVSVTTSHHQTQEMTGRHFSQRIEISDQGINLSCPEV